MADVAGLHWLMLLMDFNTIHKWDWVVLILIVLYESMDSFSRLPFSRHHGMSMMWVVYAFLLIYVLYSIIIHCSLIPLVLCLTVLVCCLYGRDRVALKRSDDDQFPLSQ